MSKKIAKGILSLFGLNEKPSPPMSEEEYNKFSFEFYFEKQRDYTSEHPDLGYSNNYQSDFANVSEYHYCQNVEGKDDEFLCAEFEASKEHHFVDSQEKGMYKQVIGLDDDGIRTIDGVPFAYTGRVIRHNDDIWTHDLLYLTIFKNEVLKYRITISAFLTEGRNWVAFQKFLTSKGLTFSDTKQAMDIYIESFIETRLKELREIQIQETTYNEHKF